MIKRRCHFVTKTQCVLFLSHSIMALRKRVAWGFTATAQDHILALPGHGMWRCSGRPRMGVRAALLRGAALL